MHQEGLRREERVSRSITDERPVSTFGESGVSETLLSQRPRRDVRKAPVGVRHTCTNWATIEGLNLP
jgi:hypothetical protein